MEIFSKQVIILILSLLFIQINSKKSACPKYSCNTQGQSDECANLTSGSTSNNVTLTPSCKKDEFCAIPLPPWKTLTNNLKDTSYRCKKKPTSKSMRYPGEDCGDGGYCIQLGHFTSLCNNGKCSGKGEGFQCSETYECKKGLYCEKSGICIKQKPYGASCSDSAQCENKYLCHEGMCSIKPFSADFGTTIDFAVDRFSYVKCKLGWTDNQYRCTQLIQNDISGEVVKCNLGDTCSYSFSTDTRSTFEKDCECGYTSAGQGYCPRGHNRSKY
jgi:hypothetical protein